MSANTNLSYIMSIFKLSNNIIAEKLNVHSTLVSKWKNDKRSLSEEGAHLSRIVELLFDMDRANGFSRLRTILSGTYKDVELRNEAGISACLRSYLTGKQNSEALSKISFNEVSERTIIDIYQGYEKKSECISRLIDFTLTLPKHRQKLFIWRNQRMHFALELKTLFPTRNERYLKLLRMGGSITIIHSLNRAPREIFVSVLGALPLASAGDISVYCEHNYAETDAIKYSIYLAEGEACSLSIEFFDNRHRNTSYYITERSMVLGIQKIYESIMLNCIPLYDKDLMLNSKLFIKFLNEMFTCKGTAYVIVSKLTPLFTMSNEFFNRLLENNGISGTDKQILAEAHQIMYNSFLEQCEKFKTYMIMVISDDIWVKAKTEFNIEYIGKRLCVDRKLDLEHIRNLEKAAKLNAMLKIYVSDGHDLPAFEGLSIIVKDNNAVVALSTNQTENKPVTIRDQVVVNAFMSCMNEYVKTIPPTDDHMSITKAFR